MFKAPGGGDRIEARLVGAAFAPHRHDTYAVGITLEGVQSFDYRGAARNSMPGQMIVLHPDELHDGRSGDGTAFRYRTAYIAPSAMQNILNGRALPFVANGLSDNRSLRAALWSLLNDLDRPLGKFEFEQALYDLTVALLDAGNSSSLASIANRKAVERACEFMEANLGNDIHLADLEDATGHDRWQLSRDFSALLSTSPYRYLVFRRLDQARRMMSDGDALVDVAYACQFSDQSHFCRTFKSAFGVTPTAWTAMHKRSRSN